MKEGKVFSVVRRGVLADSSAVEPTASLFTGVGHMATTSIQRVMEQAVWQTVADCVGCARRFAVLRLERSVEANSACSIFGCLLGLELGVPATLDQLVITIRADPEVLRHGPLVALGSELKRGKTTYSPVAFWTGPAHGKTVFSMTPNRVGGWFRGRTFLLVEGE